MPVNPAVKNTFGTLWVQPFGCGTQPKIIDCAIIEDSVTITVSGDVTSQYVLCNGRFEEIAQLNSPPERGELTVMVHLQNEANWFETLVDRGSCNFPMYIYFHCPVKGRVDGYTHVLKLTKAKITSHAVTNPVGGTEEAYINREFTISYSSSDAEFVYAPSPVLTAIAGGDTTDLQDVAYLEDEDICIGDCVEEELACSTGYTAGNGDGVTNGSPLVGVDDTCTTWSQIDTWYFGAGTVNVLSVIASSAGTEPRIIAAIDTAGPNIYYADGDEPTSTTLLAIPVGGGSPNGPNALYQREDGVIFLATNTGDIVYSEDNALTWEEASIGATDLYSVTFIDSLNGLAVGDDGAGGAEMFLTNNGGLSWVDVTLTATGISNTLVDVDASEERWYVVDDEGAIFSQKISGDLEAAWDVLPTPIIGTITGLPDLSVKGCNAVVTWTLSAGTNPGRVSYTTNGGYNWSSGNDNVVANTGYNAVHLRKKTEATIVGNGGTIVSLTGLPTFS